MVKCWLRKWWLLVEKYHYLQFDLTYLKNEKNMCLTKDLEFENMSCQEATKRLRKINEYSDDNKLTELNVLINKLNRNTAGGGGIN